MSHGLLGGLFSQRNTQDLPVSMGIGVLPETQFEPEVNRNFEFALDALSCNAMFCDRELILRYLNRASRKTLLSLQEYLPVPVDKIVGKSIHIFHKSPPNIERILGGKQHNGLHHLPHKATIPLGPVKLDLEVEPMIDERGKLYWRGYRLGHQHPAAIERSRAAQEVQRSDI